jgi:hypothetical protein
MGELVMNKDRWETSVNELLYIFRRALLEIIPWLEKARIKWKEGEAYDDWDNIVESLYENIVCASLTGEVRSEYSIARYNFYYEDYSLMDFIKVMSKDNPEKQYVFVAFQSNMTPLDNIKVAELNEVDKVVAFSSFKYDDLIFTLVRHIKGKKHIIGNLKIAL